jgi:glucokinase
MNRKIIFSLDAGGTNLVFSAIEEGKVLDQTLTLPSQSDSLETFFRKLKEGFGGLEKKLGTQAAAISFCFPGPADYEAGIIGKLENLPFFTGGIPLARMLENEFRTPVFINNDGDLFSLGEALGGLLPEINGFTTKQYKNLLGVTLGTGFGGGIVVNRRLFMGDNSASSEINRFSNYMNPSQSVEEVLSIRGIKKLYGDLTGIALKDTPEPHEIYQIGIGKTSGNKEAALEAWSIFGNVLGNALANAATLTDSCVAIGGGISGAYPLFLPIVIEHMNGRFKRADGLVLSRMESMAYNWENETERKEFLKDETVSVKVPFSNQTQSYQAKKKIAVGITKLGTSKAVALGAYVYAARKLGFLG